MKNVLLMNPVKQDGIVTDRLHMGLSLLAQILEEGGHTVRIVDYAFLRGMGREVRAPEVEEVITDFQPDVVGVTVFTYFYDECLKLVERISACTQAPLILGGPHFAVFPEDFRQDPRVSYIVRGEAEDVILELVNNATRGKRSVFIQAPSPLAGEIPKINLDAAAGNQHLKVYQIQLSRGCPYGCTFCSVHQVSSRTIRARDIDVCLEQICEAKDRWPSIETVCITDDCPTYDRERFKRFLRGFAERKIGGTIWVDNMRANLLDEEMLQLYVKAGGSNICLGVETGHPEVFDAINKGESLQDIRYAAEMIHKYRLALGLCFVIGLPGDTLERHRASMQLARQIKPDYIFWNMCIPWPGTGIHRWYIEHGTIGDIRNFSTLIDPQVRFSDPVAVSADFPKQDRIKAWLMANLETHNYFHLSHLGRIVRLVARYGLYGSLFIYLRRYAGRAMKRLCVETRKRTGCWKGSVEL